MRKEVSDTMNKKFIKWFYDQKNIQVSYELVKEVYKEKTDELLESHKEYFDIIDKVYPIKKALCIRKNYDQKNYRFFNDASIYILLIYLYLNKTMEMILLI